MRIRNGLITLVTVLLSSSILAAQIYKTTDDEGNVIFTDAPVEGQNSEEVKLKPMTTVSPPTVKPLPDSPESTEEAAEDFTYNSLQILTPDPGETIRSAGNFEIIAAVDPEMLDAHSARLLIDGKPHDKRQKSLQFFMSNVDRGAHTLEVQIVDRDGKALISNRIEVFVHRPVQQKAKVSPAS